MQRPLRRRQPCLQRFRRRPPRRRARLGAGLARDRRAILGRLDALSYAARWPEASGIIAADGPITYALHPISESEWRELEEWASQNPIYTFRGSEVELDRLLAELRRSHVCDRFDEAVARRNMRKEGTLLKSRWTPAQWLHFDRVAFGDAIETLDPDQIYPKIRCPVLLVGATQGEQAVSGRPFSRAAVEEVQARHPWVQTAWLPSGHALPIDAPQAFAAAVRNFVTAIAATRPP